jgi:hypothetical protein
MSNVAIASNLSTSITTLSFTVTGPSGTTGFGNVTIPKSVETYGTTPTIEIDGQPASSQGYTQDSNNYYVWYTTSFSTHKISIMFAETVSFPSPIAQSDLFQEVIYGVVTAAVVVSIILVSLGFILKGKKQKIKA